MALRLRLGLGLGQTTHQPTTAGNNGDEPVEQKITAANGTPNSSDVTLADAENLGLSVAANKNYIVRWVLLYTTDATTTGIEIAVNGPASPTAVNIAVCTQLAASTNTRGVVSAYETTVDCAGTAAGTNQVVIEMSLRNGANAGTVIPRFRSEINASGCTIMAGSFGQIWEVV